MEPDEFIQVLDQNGQISGVIAEVGRGKAFATVLSKAKAVDVSAFTAPALTGEGDDFIEAMANAGDGHEGHDH